MTTTTTDAAVATAATAGESRPEPPAVRARWPRRADRAALRCTGVALVLAAAGVGGGAGAVVDRTGPAAVAAATAFALWAAPPLEEPPPRAHTWLGRLAAARSTVLAAGSVLLAALGEPPFGQVAVVAALLIGYLLLVDALGPQHDRIRPAHALAALAASGLVLPVAFASTGAGEWSRPVALIGLAAVGWGLALLLPRRRPRARPSRARD